MTQYLLAHDLGTSGNKASLFSTDGACVKTCVTGYGVRYSNGNWAEQEPDDWWKAVADSTREIISAGIDPKDIVAVSFSGQMMGIVPVDKDGEALRSSIIWADMRAERQTAALVSAIGMKEAYQITGHRLSPSYPLEKLLWVKDNEPEIYKRTYKTLCAKDYIVMKLTGRFFTEPSDASGTNAFDLNIFEWSDDILGAAGVDKDIFPDIIASTDVAGKVTPEASRFTGLLEGTPVVMGGGDGLCAPVGVGAVAPGITHNCLGSSSWVCTITEKPIFDENMMLFNWAHMVPGLIAPCGTMQAAGASYAWALERFMPGKREPDISNIQGSDRSIVPGQDIHDLAAKAISESAVGAGGVVFLPYLMGERSPRWNPNARGSFIGMKMDTTNGDMLRAVIEGVGMNLNVILKAMSGRIPIDEIILIGGLAQSRGISQILADIYGMNAVLLNVSEEATSLGAAVTAGVGVGALDSFEDINKFIKVEERLVYNEACHAEYAKLQSLFDDAYGALMDIFDKIVDVEKAR